MFKKNGTCIQLADLLALLPNNDWLWSILEFNGIGLAPNNLSMSEFEKLIYSSPTGFLMSWSELKDFAFNLKQTIDCSIIAVESIESLRADQLALNDFKSCKLVLKALDSTNWFISSSKPQIIEIFLNLSREE